MFTLLMLSAPVAAMQVVAGRQPLLTISPGAAGAVAIAAAMQIAAFYIQSGARIFVPLGFALGGLAAVRTIWLSAASKSAVVLGAVGCTANFIPIAIYGAMPVQRGAFERLAGQRLRPSPTSSAPNTSMQENSTALCWRCLTRLLFQPLVRS